MAEILFYACIPLAFAAVFVGAIWTVQLAQRRMWSDRSRRIVLYRGPLSIALLVMGLGLAYSVHYADAARQAMRDNGEARFRELTDHLEAALQSRFSDLNRVLGGVRAMMVARPNITAADFQRFAQASTQTAALQGVREVGYGARDARGDVPAVLATQRGAALASMRSGQATLVRAAASSQGLPAAARSDDRAAGYLFVLPVYAQAETPATEEQRVHELRGWAFAPVLLTQLLGDDKVFNARQIQFQLYDSPDLRAQGLIYDSRLPDAGAPPEAERARLDGHGHVVVRPVTLAGQAFFLRATPTAAFEAAFETRDHVLAVMVGSGLSVLVAMVLWLLMAGRARALDLAHSMTSELERLAMVARRTSNAVFFADTGWRITWVNEGFTRMSGFSPDEAMGRRPSELLHSPLADPLTGQQIDRKAEAGERVGIRILQRSKTGRDYWVDLEVLPILSPGGKVKGYLAVQSDITEEVQVKAALLVEKERVENILSGTLVGTWESNLLTGEQRWNDRWGSMMGFAREEVLPAADEFWQQRMHPADRVRLNQALSDCLAGRTDSYACDVRAQRKDGSWMWILSRAKVMSRTRDGRAEWIGGIHTDITESKQLEISLRDMEEFLDRAGRIAGVGAWQIDLRTRAVVFSAQTCTIHGMAPDFRPSEEAALSFYPEAERARLREAMQQAEAHGTPWDMVVEFINAQGQQLWVRIFGEVGYDESGPVRLVGAFQDVTKDRLAQLEVERSGTLLRGAIEAINEAFVLFDPQDRMVFCNDKYRAMYSKSADLMQPGVSFESIIRGGAERGQYLDAMGRLEEWVAERLAAHRSGNTAMEQRLNDGRWLKVMERRMPDGHTVGFRVDITELKQATAEAERISAQRFEEQRRLQSILDGTHVGTWEWNVQTGESIYSDQYVAMVGYSREELEPHGYDTWARLAHPDDLVAAALAMQEHLRGERPGYEIEARMRHKNGHWIWVLAKGRLAERMADGSPLWVFGTHMDITERKLAEQQLAQTTATLQNVLDSATAVGVVSLGLDQHVHVFNKGAENLLGYAAEELLDQPSAPRLFDPSEIEALRETLALVCGQEVSLQETFEHIFHIRDEQEWTLVRKDGRRFKANLIFSPMRDALGVPVGNLCMIYDISRQKEYESSLREAMRLAEQSSVAKSQFLANMSHEIRTPMNAILGMLQLLRNTELQSNQRDYAEKAAGAGRSLLGLLNDILDFSKVEAGKMQLNLEPFELEGLLADLSVILSSNLGSKNVDLLFDVDPAIPHELVGDAMRLKQILINLGGNAVKFTERGQVVIRWSLLARTPERVRLAVAVVDSGIGIAPENQSRIFSAFTQAEANTTRRFGGTGLGLVISTRLIRLMGGELELSSVEGQGSTFSFCIELGVAEFARDAQAPAPAVQAAPVVRTLLVDDNPEALASSAAMMRSLGWEVTTAASGEQALGWLKASLDAGEAPPDALFVDWQMPEMDGWETLRNARRLFGAAKPPLLILLSRRSRDALAQRTDREQELLNGFMIKPFTAAMFERTLAQARDGATLREAPRGAPTQRLAGMRVLLVEDNLINQQVAQELLSAEGALVTLADNGQLGVDAVNEARPPFDAVLMDLQMPVMDGMRATRLLRADPRWVRLPIIAMTANAMSSDRDECLAAGMNDHVGKPFDIHRLVQTLIQHTRWEVDAQGAAPQRTAIAPATPAPVATVWPAGVDGEAALARMGGNAGLLQRSMAAFVLDARRLQGTVEQALQAGDRERAKRELHAFKGLSATVGVQALSDLAAQAEKRLLDPAQAADYQAVATQLWGSLAQFLPALESAVATLGGADSGRSTARQTLDQSALQQLKDLLQALQTSDMAAMELHASLRQDLDEAFSEAMAPLDGAMSDLDFEAAAVACEALVRQFENT